MRHRLFVPERLTALRVERDLTIKALAELSELSMHYVQRLESGLRHHQPSDRAAGRLIRGLSKIKPCAVDDLSIPKPEQVAA